MVITSTYLKLRMNTVTLKVCSCMYMQLQYWKRLEVLVAVQSWAATLCHGVIILEVSKDCHAVIFKAKFFNLSSRIRFKIVWNY